MSELRQRQNPIRLMRKEYQALRLQVLKRDGWRCQNCSAPENLQIHHIQRRSLLGNDSAENLIALCVTCHRLAHGVG